MQRLKVAFIGSHGVGKTTLCFDLAFRLKRLDIAVDIVKEVARHCPLPINEDTTLEAQSWIFHSQIAEEIAVAAQNQAVICDRSVLDNYAYLVNRVGRRPEFDAIVDAWMRTYTALFKVPVVAPPSFDGKRALSPTFQTEVDALIDELLAAFDIHPVLLDPNDRGGWMEQVLRALKLPVVPPQAELFTAPGW